MKFFLIIVFSTLFLFDGFTQIFVENSGGSGVNFVHDVGDIEGVPWGTGAVWLDFDMDGDMDLYLTSRVGGNRFYENVQSQSGYSFVDITNSLDAHPLCQGCVSTGVVDDCGGASAGDFDNDGDPDLYISTAREDIFLVNQGGSHFEDRSSVVLGSGTNHVTGNTRANSISWGDFDNDGFLDLYIACHLPADYNGDVIEGDTNDILLHNHQGQYFEDASFLLEDFDLLWGSSFIGTWTDFDRDDDLDLIVTNDCTLSWPTRMVAYENNGGSDWTTWSFDTVQSALGIRDCNNAMGVTVGDIDRNGYFDFAHTNIGPVKLWKNNGSSFSDVSQVAGINGQPLGHYSWGIHLADFDNDSWLDLAVILGYYQIGNQGNNDPIQPSFYYRNNGTTGETFTDLSASSGFDDDTRGRTSAIADYNMDGDIDMVVINYDGMCHFKENVVGNDYNWIQIDLEGTVSNRDGVGTIVELHCVDDAGVPYIQYAESRSGSSLGAGDAPYLHFGLGPSGTIDSIVLDWPSGIRQVEYNTPTDTILIIVESDPLLAKAGIVGASVCKEDGKVSLIVDLEMPSLVDSVKWLWLGHSLDQPSHVLTLKDAGHTGFEGHVPVIDLGHAHFGLWLVQAYVDGELSELRYVEMCSHLLSNWAYPNPVTEILYLDLERAREPISVEVRNTTGQEMPVHFLHEEQQLDVSRYSPGVYLIRISSGFDSYQTRFLKL